MPIPLPPGYKNRIPLPEKTGVGPDEMPAKVTEDETSFILKATLLPHHATDPNVLRFISAFLICRSVTQAAREAGLKPRDGEVLRRRPDIHEAIRKITEKAVLKHGYDAGEVVERVKEIAGIDPAEFENEDGSFKESLRSIPPETRRAIKKFKAKNLYEKDPNGMQVIVGKLIEVEFWDKMKAVELLGREKDLFKETRKVEHNITNNMSSFLLESKERGENYLQSLKEVGDQAMLTHSPVGEVIEVLPDDTEGQE